MTYLWFIISVLFAAGALVIAVLMTAGTRGRRGNYLQAAEKVRQNLRATKSAGPEIRLPRIGFRPLSLEMVKEVARREGCDFVHEINTKQDGNWLVFRLVGSPDHGRPS